MLIQKHSDFVFFAEHDGADKKIPKSLDVMGYLVLYFKTKNLRKR